MPGMVVVEETASMLVRESVSTGFVGGFTLFSMATGEVDYVIDVCDFLKIGHYGIVCFIIFFSRSLLKFLIGNN
jgi:fluoride ion exporter CrcB/FEX